MAFPNSRYDFSGIGTMKCWPRSQGLSLQVGFSGISGRTLLIVPWHWTGRPIWHIRQQAAMLLKGIDQQAHSCCRQRCSDMNCISLRPACPRAPGAVWDNPSVCWWLKYQSQGSGVREPLCSESIQGKVAMLGSTWQKVTWKCSRWSYSPLIFQIFLWNKTIYLQARSVSRAPGSGLRCSKIVVKGL